MNLDNFFQQILETEQQLCERTKKTREVNVAVIKCQEMIKAVTEKRERVNQELDEKAQQLSEMRLRHKLMKKQEEQMKKQIEDLLCQQGHLKEHLEKIKRDLKGEEEKFLQEITKFNSDFSLCGNREAGFDSQIHSEMADLHGKVDSLQEEMELMNQNSSHIDFTQKDKIALQFELQGLQNIRKELDCQLQEAEKVTESLRAESFRARQKPLTDNTCLRLKKELEKHNEGKLVLLREALRSERQFLHA
ncbi:coiled-coil domain-containing protein 172 [Lampris incognitus]|uniref:coiled-coil domain-containing protein 172 n=1 Tax=Lampris incognitus TaxID=2546036 RepID=UPI0024B61AE3|nr:coiled-coil domain-containing protein 172 [Lampris incognitus]